MALVDRNSSFNNSSHNRDDDVFKPSHNDHHFNRRTGDINAKFRNFTRRYILNQLHKKGFHEIAEKYETPESQEPTDGSHHMLHHLAGSLAEERERQFEDILNRLQLSNDNLSETYQVIVREMFLDGVNWGRILAFLVFSGSLSVHCAREGMESRVGDVITWTENDVVRTVARWVESQGGWEAFVEHFDAGSWTIDSPQYLLAGIVALLLGGVYLLRKLF